MVSRLFNQVQPDMAAFGKKDFQQLAVIRQLVQDLAFPVDVVGGSIVREHDGLAMSSRNQYLTVEERPRAAEIRHVLLAMREQVEAGDALATVEAVAAKRLTGSGFEVDYAVVRSPDLGVPIDGGKTSKVALVAAKLGRTRLIDNLEW